MTKKDYELIASAISFTNQLIADNKNEMTEQAVMELVEYNLAQNLRQDNPNFRADYFFKACDDYKRVAYINKKGVKVNY